MKKYILNLTLFVIISLNFQVSNAVESNDVFQTLDKTKILIHKIEASKYMDIDYFESIKIVIDKIREIDPAIIDGVAIDLNCGLGEEVSLLSNVFKKVVGLNASEDELKIAKRYYSDPKITFQAGLPNKVAHFLERNFYSLVYISNFISLTKDKISLFQQMKAITKPKGLLVVIDYVDTTKKVAPDQSAEAGHMKNAEVKKSTYPLEIDKLKPILPVIELEVLDIIDITEHEKKWCNLILNVLTKKSEDFLSNGFTHDELNLIKIKFESLKEQLDSGNLGKNIIILRRV